MSCPVSTNELSCLIQCAALFQPMSCPVSTYELSCFIQWAVLFQPMSCPVSTNKMSCLIQWAVLFQPMSCPVSTNEVFCLNGSAILSQPMNCPSANELSFTKQWPMSHPVSTIESSLQPMSYHIFSQRPTTIQTHKPPHFHWAMHYIANESLHNE